MTEGILQLLATNTIVALTAWVALKQVRHGNDWYAAIAIAIALNMLSAYIIARVKAGS